MVLFRKSQFHQRTQNVVKVFKILVLVPRTPETQVAKVAIGFQSVSRLDLLVRAEHVEYVKVALVVTLKDDPGTLQEKLRNNRPGHLLVAKEDSDEFSESGRVVVPDGLCVAKCLQQRIRLENSLLDVRRRVLRDARQKRQHVFRGLRLPSARFSRDEDRGVDAVVEH